MGVKSSLLSSRQSAGISSMPRSLCAAKREIKETVISSAASAGDSNSRVGLWSREGGYAPAKGCKGKTAEGGREGWGRIGLQTVGSTLWYKVLQLSEALWRESTRGRWGCDEPRGATGREGVKATMNFEQNQSGLVVWLKCATDYNCSDHQGRGMKQKTATADYGIIPSATHSWLLCLCTFNQFLSKNKNQTAKTTVSEAASWCVFTEDHNVSNTENIKNPFLSLKNKAAPCQDAVCPNSSLVYHEATFKALSTDLIFLKQTSVYDPETGRNIFLLLERSIKKKGFLIV